VVLGGTVVVGTVVVMIVVVVLGGTVVVGTVVVMIVVVVLGRTVVVGTVVVMIVVVVLGGTVVVGTVVVMIVVVVLGGIVVVVIPPYAHQGSVTQEGQGLRIPLVESPCIIITSSLSTSPSQSKSPLQGLPLVQSALPRSN
jgi:hypothetical protein